MSLKAETPGSQLPPTVRHALSRVKAAPELPPEASPSVAPPDASPGGRADGPVSPKKLDDAPFSSNGFSFPLPTTTAYQAILTLATYVNQHADGKGNLPQPDQTRLTVTLAWIVWNIRRGKAGSRSLLQYACGGELDLDEATEAVDAEIPAGKMVPYMVAAAEYVGWVTTDFSQGAGSAAADPAPEASAAETADPKSGSSSS